MHTVFFTHSDCLEHDTGEGHPESISRLKAILQALETEEFMFLDRRDAPMGTKEQVALAHPGEYFDKIMATIPDAGHNAIDGDTIVSPQSGKAALRGVGAAVAAVDAVFQEPGRNAFCATRPPGHHAEPARAMGFCLFNNVAIAAEYARMAYGIEKVAIVDFDVHHGNGTQACFFDDENTLYVSSHQSPLYPGTGSEAEKGISENILNVEMPSQSGSEEFQEAFNEVILPKIDEFAPDLLIISAGFDAHRLDPLAQMNLHERDYAFATEALLTIADAHCDGKVISVLEGGYDIPALSRSVVTHLRVLMGHTH